MKSVTHVTQWCSFKAATAVASQPKGNVLLVGSCETFCVNLEFVYLCQHLVVSDNVLRSKGHTWSLVIIS